MGVLFNVCGKKISCYYIFWLFLGREIILLWILVEWMFKSGVDRG